MQAFRNRSFIVFGLMVFIKPGCISGMPALSAVDRAFNIARILLVIYTAASIAKGVRKVRTGRVFGVFLLITASCTWEVAATFLNGRTVSDWGALFNGAGILIFAYAALKTDMDTFIEGAARLFWWYVVINTVTVAAFPRGMYATARYSRNYFLSYRTSWFAVYLLGAMFSLLLYEKNRRKKDARMLASLLACEAVSMGIVWTATGLFSLAAAGILLLIWKKEGSRGAHIETIILLEAAVFFGVVIKRLQKHMSFLLVDIMNKDTTLTFRTRIWDSAIACIKKHAATGVGRLDAGTMREILGYGASHPHCRYLYVAMCSGAAGLLLYILTIYAAFRRNPYGKASPAQSRILAAAAVAMLTAGQVESFSATGTYLYLLFMTAAELNSCRTRAPASLHRDAGLAAYNKRHRSRASGGDICIWKKQEETNRETPAQSNVTGNFTNS